MAYQEYTVPVPDVKGKIRTKKNGYVELEIGRTYYPEKKYNVPKRVAIGKIAENNKYMYPNEKYYDYIDNPVLPEVSTEDEKRSKCLEIGSYIVIKKIIKDYKLDTMIENLKINPEGLLLDLVSYFIVEQDNAGQYFPDYARTHPLFSKNMHIYSDSTVSLMYQTITKEQILDFLEAWNKERDHTKRIYTSYDNSNKNCQAGEVYLAEYGNAKDDESKPIVNYSIVYDTENREPILFEIYPGSIPDVSQLQYLVDKLTGYGYNNVGIILDRGYFSKKNIRHMDRVGIPFVIMVKGMKDFVEDLVSDISGTFEQDRRCRIGDYKLFGTTVKRKMYADDEHERYIHLFYDDLRGAKEREEIEAEISKIRKTLEQMIGERIIYEEPAEKAAVDADGTVLTKEQQMKRKKEAEKKKAEEEKKKAEADKNAGRAQRADTGSYFELITDKDGVLIAIREKDDVINEAKKHCGYFTLVTSENMTAERALKLYKGRDPSEKLFRGEKSYLGSDAYRVQSEESTEAKGLVQFIALIIRQKIYTYLLDEQIRMEKRHNFMTVPAAIKELNKIEMVKLPDGKYRMNWALTKTQKTILSAFGISEAKVQQEAKKIGNELYSKEQRNRHTMANTIGDDDVDLGE